MAENSKIEWTDHTFNPWIGCIAVSDGCRACYAEAQNRRYGRAELFEGAPPCRTSEANWRKPVLWNRKAQETGIRRRVFCASWADVFDDRVPAEWRADLWALIAATPWLDWLILTKRPENISSMLPEDWGPDGGLYDNWSHVWLGVTVENRWAAKERIPILRGIPAVVRFLSCEPLLEPIKLDLNGIDWVIVGGETGGWARPMQMEWAVDILGRCLASRSPLRILGAPFFMKQMGSRYDRAMKERGHRPDNDWGYIPPELRVREFPCP